MDKAVPVSAILMIAIVSAVVFDTCNPGRSPSDAGATVQLPSGKTVRVYPVERIAFVNDMLPPSLLLRYETGLEPVDSRALRDEVLEIWQILQPKADSSGTAYAMIRRVKPQAD